MKKLRVAIYCRVANHDQLTLASQKGCVEHYASDYGYEIMESMSDTGSGNSLDRPGIRRLCELADARAVDAVIATCPSRYARNMLLLMDFMRDMNDKEVEGLTVSNGSLTGMLGDLEKIANG